MKRFLMFVMLLLALKAPAAIKYYDDYPNVTDPPTSYIVSLQTTDKTVGGTPYNFWTLNQMVAWLALRGFTNVTINATNIVVSNLTAVTINSTTNFFTIVTNNTFVNTNVFISTSNAFFNNTYATNITVNNITNTTLITTNVTIMAGGGLTNFNASPNTLTYWDVNDGLSFVPSAGGALTNDGAGNVGWYPLFLPDINGNATNMTFWGVTAFDEGDFNQAFFTNAFFLHTNWAVVSFDGNGQPALGIPVAGTNLFLLSGDNITFTTNVDGSVTIAASGSLNITTITNTTLYSTNIYVTTLYAQTNYSTNLYYVSGKGNTLIITNISIEGSATNKGVAASSIVATDSAQVETNAVLSPRLTFTGNVLDVASASLTNLNYLMPTNNGNGNALVFGGVGTSATLYLTNITANTTLAAFTITTVGQAGGIKLYATCSGGADKTLTFPNGCVGAGSLGGAGKPPVVTVTNGAAAWFDVITIPGQTTNVFWAPVF